MPTNYTSRILIIAGVVLAALWSIFPGIFKGQVRPDLKPGIDMVGGTSLLYEIKSQDGGPTSGRLAEEVMSVLKKRVDPDGQRNLIWRPQGNERLEIQMPLTANSGESKAKRQAFAEAQRKLEQTNVRSAQVLAAVETMTGDARRDRLNQLAAGSPRRAQLFGALASVWDQLQKAKAEQNAAVQADKEIEYARLKAQIEETNVSPVSLEQMLATPAGQKRLEELEKQFKEFPARVDALGEFARAHAEYQKVKGTLDDAAELKRLLQGSGVLEFHIIVEYDRANPPPDVAEMIDRLQKRGPVAQATDTMRWYQLDQPEEMADVAVQWNGQSWVLAYTDPARAMANRAGQPKWELARANAESDPGSGERVVTFMFDAQGADYFGDLTQANIGKRLGIVLDDRMISAPVINSRISANGQITGNRAQGGFTAKEQGYLVSMLRAGSLPARLTDEPIREQTVGPQIGADNLRAGLIACAFGLIVVAFFLIGYYYLAGVVAFCAVLLNMVIILGAMAALNATFTLPGVAGIVLTIGMAVDANVLIFERLREEQQRGLSLRMALRNAYDRAWSAILDGNVTTGITAAALYVFGSEEVKGFGLTLLIGIVASLFTALYVTKTIFGLLIDHGGVTKLGSLPLTFPNWDRMLRPNIDWMRLSKYFYAFSAAFILIGLTLFGIKLAQGQMMDIEFASGTGVQFELKQPMKIEEVRRVLNEESERNPTGLPAPSIYSVENSETTYEVVTPTPDAVKVREAVLEAMGERLKLELPSQFKGEGREFRDALNNQIVVPIKTVDQQVAGFSPPQLASHLEGVAIVLENLDPPLRPSEVKARMERVRLQPGSGGTMQPYRSTDVVNPEGNDEPSKTLVVLVSDPAFEHKANELTWQQELAAPIWRLVSEGVGGEPSLQKVVNFDAQVAAETQREATIAMLLSIGGIMAYIWLRFGNLKYGTATVIALAHDVLFTLAAIGVAHYVAPTFIGRGLLIEPFRINLTMIAALLTIMGYSMNDTVVIFDRIRENRGRFGAVSRRVINDSINQTLSRTLLTGGTTILTIFVMYVWGGPGIHGFTYALLLGILVGTYSSIAIASPILLFGGKGPEEGPREAKRETKEAEKPLEPVGQLQRA